MTGRSVAPGPAAIVLRRARRRSRGLRALGAVLIAYGLSGLVLLGLVGWAIGEPIDQIVRLGQSVESQRAAALDALERTSETLADAAAGVGNMDGSLSQAQTATDQSSGLARGMAASMYELAQAMTLTVFGIQPLVGLSPGFRQTGDNMLVLADDLSSISTALDRNRQDATTVARSLDELAGAVDDLTDELRGGPGVEIAPETARMARVGILAVLVWLGLMAVAAVAVGLYLWRLASREQPPDTTVVTDD